MAESLDLSPANAVAVLAERQRVERPAVATLLGGGVSNTVVLVEDTRQRTILKQSLPQLRVRDEWLADRSRIVREWESMVALGQVLPAGRLPKLLFHDPDRYLYAMRAAPHGHVDWKSRLLRGECSGATARLAGVTLGLMIRHTWALPTLRERFGDQRAFDQLRTDAYYRTVARRHPAVATAIHAWIEESSDRRIAMVHGDWSPKNLLVGDGALMCIDFECAHYGDPSYDAAFLLNHLILKAFHRPELASRYLRLARISWTWTLGPLPAEALSWFEAAVLRHLSMLLLARIDGKSPAEYLRQDRKRELVRQLGLGWIRRPPESLDATLDAVAARATATLSRRSTRRP